jgi:hypothetical protein
MCTIKFDDVNGLELYVVFFQSISKVQDDYIITPFQLFTQSSKSKEILQQHDIIPAPAYKILGEVDFAKIEQ